MHLEHGEHGGFEIGEKDWGAKTEVVCPQNRVDFRADNQDEEGIAHGEHCGDSHRHRQTGQQTRRTARQTDTDTVTDTEPQHSVTVEPGGIPLGSKPHSISPFSTYLNQIFLHLLLLFLLLSPPSSPLA